MRRAVVGVAVALVLTGCGQASKPTSAQPRARDYADVGELRTALAGAGVDCTAYNERDPLNLTATSAADCTESIVLTVFASDADLSEQNRRDRQAIAGSGLGDEWILVGPNWRALSSDAPFADSVVRALGARQVRLRG